MLVPNSSSFILLLSLIVVLTLSSMVDAAAFVNIKQQNYHDYQQQQQTPFLKHDDLGRQLKFFGQQQHDVDDDGSSVQQKGLLWKQIFQSMPRSLTSTAAVVWIGVICSTGPFQQVAYAGSLLDEYGGADFKTQLSTKKSSTTTTDAKVAVETDTKQPVQIDPTLRGSYYYPTAKKRYLPRIQKVSKEIVNVPKYIETNDWDSLTAFGVTAENAVLPLFLYQSSLDGQGLSLSNSYAKAMKQDAQLYETSYKQYVQAIKKKDVDKLFTAVTDMGYAITDYRQQGRLSDDDGYIPSIDEMKRMTMRRPTVKVITSSSSSSSSSN